MANRQKIIALGGTFDHFHAGHMHFIDFAASLGTELRIGITSKELTMHKVCAAEIQPYPVRVKAVQKYCQKMGYNLTISQLKDVYGPTLEDKKIAALAVTELTQPGAQKINLAREAMSLRPLPVHVCTMLRGEDGEIITSTRVRTGEINREGRPYAPLFNQEIVISDSTRTWLQEQHGELVSYPTQSKRSSYRAVVGDVVLETFRQELWFYNLGVYDLKNKRQPYESKEVDAIWVYDEVENKPGVISQQLVKALQKRVTAENPQVRRHIKVIGEEDLATTALILLAPLSSQIYYGLHDVGIVELTVTEELKEAVFKLLAADVEGRAS